MATEHKFNFTFRQAENKYDALGECHFYIRSNNTGSIGGVSYPKQYGYIIKFVTVKAHITTGSSQLTTLAVTTGEKYQLQGTEIYSMEAYTDQSYAYGGMIDFTYYPIAAVRVARSDHVNISSNVENSDYCSMYALAYFWHREDIDRIPIKYFHPYTG